MFICDVPVKQPYSNNEAFQRYYTVISRIDIGDWEMHLRQDPEGGRFFMQIQFVCEDNNDPDNKDYKAYCRKWYLSPWMTNSEIVRTAWKAYEAAVIHEAQEKFKYKGAMVYNPHVDVEALVEISNRNDERK